jgi:MoaA/NifB/PqqE/SkfB family radical SAM enzyme
VKEHALFCIDAPRVDDPAAEVAALAGWCLCTQPIESIEAELPGLGVRPLTYGLSRPDVADSFGSYANARHCGFRLELPRGRLDARNGTDLTFTLTVKGRFGIRRRYAFRTDLSSNHIRQAKLWKEGQRAGISPQAVERRLRKSLERKPGLVVRLDVINKCNLRCVMCLYADDDFYRQPLVRLTVEELERLLQGISPYVRSIMLSCRHEALTSGLFGDILSHIAEKYPWMEMELCTNAMLMDAKTRRLLIEKGVTYLMLSMDAVSKELLERIRVGADYETIVANILALRDLKRASASKYPIFVVDYAMMTSNIHEAPAFVEMSSRMGVRAIDFRLLIPNRVLSEPEYFLDNDRARFNYFRSRIVEAGRRFKVDILIPPAFETADVFSPEGVPPVDLADFERMKPDEMTGEVPVPRRFPWWFKPRRTRGTVYDLFSKEIPGVYCERPFSEITILDHDRVGPCDWYRPAPARISEGKSLAEIFFSDRFKELRKNMLKPGGDPNCWGCPVKAGYLPTEKA